MCRLAVLLIALCLSLPAFAEQKKTFGDLDVHYSAFTSGYLQPDIAAANGLTRSKKLGVMNIAVLKAGKATTANVSGTMKNLLGKDYPLSFKAVNEGEAIYYLAQFPLESQEMLRFTINVSVSGGATNSFEFNQELYPGE
ncbi:MULTISPECIES: DUF4426 domain-containing protein [Pseudomonas]|uniref:DUF4426 domain-containing protein n=1 Tax=Pseudomonas TaxID=286 RepID=UPI003001DED2